MRSFPWKSSLDSTARIFHGYNFHWYNYNEAVVSQILCSANSQNKAKGFDENTNSMFDLTIRIGHKPAKIFILHCWPWTFQSHGSRACHLCLCRTPQILPARKNCEDSWNLNIFNYLDLILCEYSTGTTKIFKKPEK